MIITRERINRLYNRYMQKNANFLFREITKTAKITTNPSSESVIYCAIGNNASRQYLAAIKSFLRFYNDVRVVVQSDGTLTEKYENEIRSHLPGVEIYSQDDMFECIDNFVSPELADLLPNRDDYFKHTSVKIVYLKFLNVIFRLNGSKVVIIDSDILFLRNPEFIVNWLKSEYTHDFYGEGSNARSADFHNMGFEFKSLDVANFSSGTIGIGGHVAQEELVRIFKKIRDYDSSLFYSWEIEQALWSIIMATRKNPVNIDSLRDVYVGSGWRSYRDLKDNAVIAHFAGAVRFNKFRYMKLFNDFIKNFMIFSNND